MINLINKAARHKPKSFIAPVMTKHAKLFVVQDNIPYWFVAEVEYPDWYVLIPNKDTQTARVMRNAHPNEYIGYMSILPSFFVIALFPISNTVWLVMPFNFSDAAQRGWATGSPRPMHLVLDNITALDVVKARALGDALIFDHLSSIMSGGTKEFQVAQSVFDKRLEAVRDAEKREEEKSQRHARQQKMQTERGKLETALEFMGAKLSDWTREIDGYLVRWEIDGQVYRMNVDTNLRVKSAGVCLDGTDDWHSLSSVVGVMQERAGAIENDEHGDW